jgi:hypothetical protein
MGKVMPDHAKLRESIVHGLRSQGWDRIDAENEADDRIERMRQREVKKGEG